MRRRRGAVSSRRPRFVCFLLAMEVGEPAVAVVRLLLPVKLFVNGGEMDERGFVGGGGPVAHVRADADDGDLQVAGAPELTQDARAVLEAPLRAVAVAARNLELAELDVGHPELPVDQ